MLVDRFTEDGIRKALLTRESWKPFPPAADRDAWNGLLRHRLNARRRDFVLDLADKILSRPWTTIPVSRYFDFVRTGDRDAFEDIYMKRSQDLAAMVLAACFSHDMKHIEAALDMVWSICEESSWGVSAHVLRRTGKDGTRDPMPDLSCPIVELFSCETAAILAETLYLLGAEFDRISPLIRERVESEIDLRILSPFESRSDFHWLPYRNNWTPWCICSVFIAASYVVGDNARLARMIRHGIELMEPYIGTYPEDASCDEGPSYWGASPGALLLLLETLHSRSGGVLDVFDDAKFARMGKYLGDMHMVGPWFFDYSDTPAKCKIPVAKVHRYGERIGDGAMKNMALLAQRNWKPEAEPDASLGLGTRCGDMIYALREIFWVPSDAKPFEMEKPLSVWYPHAQLLVARESSKAEEGLVLAAKGGSNGENHNHNDVGEFLVYADGEPVIVDPGRGKYLRQNFSAERYNIWWNAARGHDLLQFGCHEQAPGGESRAELLRQSDDGIESVLELDLSRTFSPAAGLVSWRRRFLMRRGGDAFIRITDTYELKSPMVVSLPIYSPRDIVLADGSADFPLGSGRLAMRWNPDILAASLREMEDHDPYMVKCWGGSLNKLLLETREKAGNGLIEIEFRLP